MEVYLEALVSVVLFCVVHVFRLGWKLGGITTKQADHEKWIKELRKMNSAHHTHGLKEEKEYERSDSD